MTPSRTPFAGFEVLGPGDPLSSDGYAFQSQNPVIADLLAKIGAVLHRHDAHAAMADPTLAPTVSVAATGGALRSGQTIYVVYTLLDGQGGETLPVAVANAATPAGYTDPTAAPTAVVSTSAGSMLASTPLYAVSVTDGVGGETALGPPVAVTVPSAAHAEVLLSGLTAITNTSSGSSSTAGWRLWRSEDGGTEWDLMATGSHTTDTFTDTGASAGDCSVNPLSVGTTGNTGLLSVTVPGGQPASATFFRVYASTDGAFVSPCRLGTYAIAGAGTPITYTALAVAAGAPPAVSRCYPGANQIDPDTDILSWPWKQPVANVAALPAIGNSDGDMRETLDDHVLQVWNGSAWAPGGGAVGATGAAGSNGTNGTNGTRGSLWYVGTGAPGTISGQRDDDMYLDTVATSYYQLISGTWTLEGSLGGLTPSTTQAGTSYTFVLADAESRVKFTSATAVTATVPPHSSVAYPVDVTIEILQYGAGTVTVSAGAGVTIRSPGSLVASNVQYSMISLVQVAIDEWVLAGDLA